MKDLFIERSKGVFFTPHIHFQVETGNCEISGESYIENAPAFYQPLIDWVDEFRVKTDKKMVFNFKLTYFNTSSSKSILNLMVAIKKIHDLNWYYPDDNYDLLAEAEDFMEDVLIRFNLIPYKLNY
jgi:hypothetical protein